MATVWSKVVWENPIQIIYRHLPICLRIPTGKNIFLKKKMQLKIGHVGTVRNCNRNRINVADF
jgi:hypothetical protein